MADASDEENAFLKRGFLAPEVIAEVTARMRRANKAWFDLCENLSEALQRSAVRHTDVAAKSLSFDPTTVAELFALRAAGALQGAIVMAERGMLAESRTLVRTVLEAGFCLVALVNKPKEFLAMVEADDAAARKGQAKAILKNNLAADPASLKRLQEFVDGLPKVRTLSMEPVADLGPLNVQYLLYRILSNDAVHASATSLKRHMGFNADKTAWTGFVLGPAKFRDIAETLDYAAIGGIGVGIALSEIFEDEDSNAEFAALSKQYQDMTAKRMAGEAR